MRPTSRSTSSPRVSGRPRAMILPNGCGPRSRRSRRKYQARVKVSEVPPGPPVLQTLVAEVYGPNYERQIEIARPDPRCLRQNPRAWWMWTGTLRTTSPNIGSSWIKKRPRSTAFLPSRSQTRLRMAVEGMGSGLLHQPTEKEDVAIFLRLPGRSGRASRI